MADKEDDWLLQLSNPEFIELLTAAERISDAVVISEIEKELGR